MQLAAAVMQEPAKAEASEAAMSMQQRPSLEHIGPHPPSPPAAASCGLDPPELAPPLDPDDEPLFEPLCPAPELPPLDPTPDPELDPDVIESEPPSSPDPLELAPPSTFAKPWVASFEQPKVAATIHENANSVRMTAALRARTSIAELAGPGNASDIPFRRQT